jgi:NitT/TauT family transport system permease protein/sulfonate transport system permease protein
MLAWQGLVQVGIVDKRYFGSPLSIADAALNMLRSGELQRHFFASMVRVLIGYTTGATAGVLVGLLLGRSRILRAAFEPLISGLYVVPKLAILPILLLVFGLGETPMVILVSLAVFFIVSLGTISATLATPSSYIEVGRSFGASEIRLFRDVIMPSALPQVIGSLRIGSGMAVLMLIAAEFVSAEVGLGYLIWHSWSVFRADQMYVGIITVSISGVLFSLLIARIGRWLAPWATYGNVQDEVI